MSKGSWLMLDHWPIKMVHLIVLWDWKDSCCMKGALHSSSNHLEITTSKRHVDHLKTQSKTENFFWCVNT